MIIRAALLCCAVLCSSPVLAQTDSSGSQDKWQCTVANYLCASGLGDRTLNGSEVEVKIGQLIENLCS
jgi:hypothetical protein